VNVIVSVAIAVGAALLMLLPGAAWAAWLPAHLKGRVMLGPLIGIASTAWLVQLAYYIGLSAGVAAALAIFASAILVVARHRQIGRESDGFLHMATLYLCCFLGSLSAVSLTVWPAAGPWAADWSANLGQLEALWTGAPLKEWLLARPPLFAAAAVPFHFFLNSLPALQVSACAFAGAALVAVLWLAGEFGKDNRLEITALWVVGFSMFYLVNLTAIVPKFVQGVLIVSAFVALKGARKNHSLSSVGFSALLICLAVEVHHSSVVYAIAYAVALSHAAQHRPPRVKQFALLCLILLLVIVAVPELLRIGRFGMDQIVRFNPSVAMRGSQSAWIVFLLNLESIFVGWGYLLPIWNIIKVAHDASIQTISYYAKWIVLMHLAMMSNTLLLILLPLVFTRERLKSYLSFLRKQLPPAIAAGLATVPVATALLVPSISAAGIVHSGATALAVGALIVGMAWLATEPSHVYGTRVFTLLAGTFWWCAWNVTQYVAVLQAGGFANSGPRLDDQLDLPLLLASGQVPWGYGQFPWMPLVLASGTAITAAMVTILAKDSDEDRVSVNQLSAAAK
jgi:hypothetical protein